jgi:hypothetical protein
MKFKVIIEGKEYNAKSISHITATRLYNRYHKNGFPINSHSLKCNDSFSIQDEKIKLISFIGSEPDFIILADGKIIDGTNKKINAKYKLNE